jgi:carbon storage regulator
MLILTRRSGEAIDIGDDIEITVLEVSGEHVRLGITAPRSLAVVRKELLEDVARENRLAAASPGRLGLRLTHGLKVAESPTD